MDAAAIRRDYLPIYEEFEADVEDMMQKYKQQEEVNKDLIAQIEMLEDQGNA